MDAARIVVGGDSAGGNLALATALLLRDQRLSGGGGPALAGVHCYYPVTDSACGSPSYTEFAEGYGLTRAAMRAYWELYLRDAADALNPLAAPVRADAAGLPPVLIQLAELDVLHDEGAAMARRLEAAGVPTTLHRYSGVLHGFARLTGAVEKARASVADAGAWLRRITG